MYKRSMIEERNDQPVRLSNLLLTDLKIGKIFKNFGEETLKGIPKKTF
jgi:hypothetical protein